MEQCNLNTTVGGRGSKTEKSTRHDKTLFQDFLRFERRKMQNAAICNILPSFLL
jgi:hypothetical protein